LKMPEAVIRWLSPLTIPDPDPVVGGVHILHTQAHALHQPSARAVQPIGYAPCSP
jgi:hypothetical protein